MLEKCLGNAEPCALAILGSNTERWWLLSPSAFQKLEIVHNIDIAMEMKISENLP